jgi:hypothetical protein
MNGAIHEYPAVARRVSSRKFCIINEIAGVGENHERTADSLIIENSGGSVAIGRIEPSRETSHDLQIGMLSCSINHRLCLYRTCEPLILRLRWRCLVRYTNETLYVLLLD